MKHLYNVHHHSRRAHSSLIRCARRNPVLLAVPLITALLITISASVFADSAGRLGSINMTVPPGGDTFQMSCRKLQQADNDLRAKYADPNITAERGEAIGAELENIELEWHATDCQAAWGDINGSLRLSFIATRRFPPTVPVIHTPPTYPTTPPSSIPMKVPGRISGESTDNRYHNWIDIGGSFVTSTPVPPTPGAIR